MTKYNKDESYWIGQRFGKGVVMEKTGEIIEMNKGPKGYEHKRYPRTYDKLKLKCDCGQEYETTTKNLFAAKPTQSCGCLRRGEDLTGKKFGLGTVQRFSHYSTHGQTPIRRTVEWELKCECGNIYTSSTENLNCGDVSSCGCAKTNFCSIKSKKQTVGRWWKRMNYESKSRSYKLEVTKEQCLNLLKEQNYKCKLTGVDISIEDGTASLDRIDNNKNYTLDNIQWVLRRINFMKNTLSQDDFISLCSLVCDYNRNPGL